VRHISSYCSDNGIRKTMLIVTLQLHPHVQYNVSLVQWVMSRRSLPDDRAESIIQQYTLRTDTHIVFHLNFIFRRRTYCLPILHNLSIVRMTIRDEHGYTQGIHSQTRTCTCTYTHTHTTDTDLCGFGVAAALDCNQL